MANKNYRPKTKEAIAAAKSVEMVVDDKEFNEKVEEVSEKIEEVKGVKEDVFVEGYVTAKKLNVRTEPNKEAKVVTIIDENTHVLINETLSTDDWYEVVIEPGVTGFCMKEFIKVKRL